MRVTVPTPVRNSVAIFRIPRPSARNWTIRSRVSSLTHGRPSIFPAARALDSN